MDETTPKILNLNEVASAIGCSYEHARSLCAKGLLVFLNIGTGSRNVYRVRQDDLENYLNDRRRASGRLELENVRTTLKSFANVEQRW